MKNWKKVISAICIVAMIFSSLAISPKEEARAASNLRYVTLRDFGIDDGPYAKAGDVAVGAKITTLTNTEMVLKATWAGMGPELCYGGNGSWNGIRIYLRADSDANGHDEMIFDALGGSGNVFTEAVAAFAVDSHTILGDEKQFVGTELTMKMVTEASTGSKVKMTFYINDILCGSMEGTPASTYQGGFSVISDAVPTNITVASVEKPPTPVPTDLTQLTLKDFGYDGTVSGSSAKQLNKTGVTSLEKTLLSTHIQMTNTENEGIHLFYGTTGKGTTDKGVWLQFLPHTNTINLVTTNQNGVTAFDGTTGGFSITNGFDLDLSIEYVGNDVKLGVWFNDVLYNNEYITISGYKTNMGDYIWFEPITGAGTLTMVFSDQMEPKPADLREITTADFGITDAEYSSDKYGAYSGTETNMLHTTFRHTVKFHYEAAGDFYVCYGANGNGWDGMRIIPNADGTLTLLGVLDGQTLATLNPSTADLESFLDTEFELGVDMWESDSDVKVDVFINGVQYNTRPYVWTGAIANNRVGNNINLIMSGGNTIQIGESEPVKPADLREITIANFGLEDQVYSETKYAAYTGTETNMLNTSFRYRVEFHYTGSNDGYICYGANGNGWDGLRVVPQANGTLKLYAPIDDVYLATLNPDAAGLESFLDTEFELGIDFWNSRNDVKIDVYINGEPYNAESYVWTGAIANNRVGNNINLIVSGGNEIRFGKLVFEEVEQLPEDFTVVTMNDFGMADGTYTDTQINYHKELTIYNPNTTHSLDKKIFSTQLSVTGDSQHLFYGYNSDPNKSIWFIFNPTSNVVHFQTPGVETTFVGATGGFDITNGNSIDFKVSTEYIDADNDGVKNDVKIGVWFNGVLYDNTYITKKDFSGQLKTAVAGWRAADQPATMTISTPKHTLPENYNQATFIDAGIGNWENRVGQASSSQSIAWDGMVFSGKAALFLNEGQQSEIRFGATGGGWTGLRLRMTAAGLAMDWAGFTTTITPVFANIQSGELFTFNIATEYVDIDNDGAEDDVKLGVWLNGEMYGNRWMYLQDFAMNDAAGSCITICLQETEQNVKSSTIISYMPNLSGGSWENGTLYYNLANGSYLLSANGTITVNGVTMQNGDVLDKAGDYHIVCTDGAAEYTTDVVLYRLGNTHADGVVNACDVVALKKMTLGDTENVSPAGRRGADLNQDGVIDGEDFASLRYMILDGVSVVAGEKTFLSYSADDTAVMPIAGYAGPSGTLVNDDVYKMIKDSGVNLITYGVKDDDAEAQLTLADKYGISLLVQSSSVGEGDATANSLASKLADYSMHKSFKGLLLTDEPGNDTYASSDENKMADYRERSQMLNQYSNLTGYINLLPYAENLGTKAQYKAYLEEYCETMSPKMLSYDYYPFDNGGNKVTSEKAFFNNLAVVASTASAYDIPMWAFVQAGSNWGEQSKSTTNNVPSAGAFKWSANMSLAFGAKGISYFPLVQPEGWEVTTSGANDYRRNGLIGRDGVANDWYTYAQAVNKQIQAVDNVLMNSENQGIMVTGYYATQNTSACATNGVSVLTSFREVTGISTNETHWLNRTNGAVAGCFDYMGKTAVYVVNHDIGSAHNITLSLNGNCSYQVINYNGITESSGSSCVMTLAAGEAALVVIE